MRDEPARKTRVFVVDDEEMVCRMLKRRLEDNGRYEVYTESSGSAAPPSAKRFRPDVVILDVIMPERSGLEVADDLRSDPELAQVPIIFLTAFPGKMMEEKRAQGFTEEFTVLSKPQRTQDLIACIDRLVQIRPVENTSSMTQA